MSVAEATIKQKSYWTYLMMKRRRDRNRRIEDQKKKEKELCANIGKKLIEEQ